MTYVLIFLAVWLIISIVIGVVFGAALRYLGRNDLESE